MVTTATLEVIEQIHNTVDEDPCLTEREIADIKGISDVDISEFYLENYVWKR